MHISVHNVGLEWPNGSIQFENLNFTLEQRRHALIGVNGSGKTTLAKLLAGQLEPSHGRITKSGQVHIFAQSETAPETTVENYLADAPVTQPWIHQLLANLNCRQACDTLSGGEWHKVRLAKAALKDPDLLILDEPTNHLDRDGRDALFSFIENFQGSVLVISHDRELLNQMNCVLELSRHGLKKFSGTWSEFEAAREEHRRGLEFRLESAKRLRDQTKRDRQDKLQAQEKRQRRGASEAARGGMPKILIGARKRRAQATKGRIDAETSATAKAKVSEAWQAFQELEFDPAMYAKLNPVNLPAQQQVLEALEFNARFPGGKWLWNENLNLTVKGPAKLAVRGANGSGKSTLFKLLLEQGDCETKGLLRRGQLKFAFLDQTHREIQGEKSILAFLQERLTLTESELRAGLATFLFAGDSVFQKVNHLSGGERLRLHLALVLLNPKPAEVLILDEPTNDLDLRNIEFLEGLLKAYQGAVILACHDEWFLERIQVTQAARLQ